MHVFSICFRIASFLWARCPYVPLYQNDASGALGYAPTCTSPTRVPWLHLTCAHLLPITPLRCCLVFYGAWVGFLCSLSLRLRLFKASLCWFYGAASLCARLVGMWCTLFSALAKALGLRCLGTIIFSGFLHLPLGTQKLHRKLKNP